MFRQVTLQILSGHLPLARTRKFQVSQVADAQMLMQPSCEEHDYATIFCWVRCTHHLGEFIPHARSAERQKPKRQVLSLVSATVARAQHVL